MVLYCCKNECPEYEVTCSGTIPEYAMSICQKLGYNNRIKRYFLLNPELPRDR